MLHAFFSNLLETLRNRVIKGGANPYVKSSPNKSEAQRLARQFSEFNADPAKDAFARLKNDAAGLQLLIKASPFRFEAPGFGTINLGVML